MVNSHSLLAVSVVSLVSLVSAQKCTIQFDGRVPGGTAATAFDANNKFFQTTNVLPTGLKFSQLVEVGSGAGSLFDVNTVPVGVTISDKSIFNGQTGFRRSELVPASNSGTDPSTQGVKTLHFSVMQDAARPLNFSHEYQLAFLESKDFSTNQIVLKVGTVLGQAGGPSSNTLQLFGNVNKNPPVVLFSTPFTPGVFNNFAITNDFDKLTSEVFFSTGASPLKAVTKALANDVSGQGQFHFGVLKKPVNGGADITKSGFQEAGINEGVIFGGIFEEDSAAGCVSLSP